jgi:ABC-type sugar transport system ATPase subunit
VLVFDEPLVGADGAEVTSLIHILRDLAAAGIASLYLTRSAKEAAQMTDRITVLRDGSLVGTFERPDYDLATLALAMMTQHPEREPGPETSEAGSRWKAAFRALVG